MNDILKTLIDALKKTAKPKTSAYDTEAVVKRVDSGTAWVHIPGGIDETPVKLTIAASVGDTVQVRVSGGRAFLVGNASAPPTDDTTAKHAQTAAVSAQRKAAKAQATAEEAQAAADATTQYFWHDANGAHVTTTPQAADSSGATGYNSLWNSVGLLLRNGAYNLVALTGSSVIFYDGAGNDPANIIATFGASGAVVGKASGNHTQISSDSFDIYNGSIEMAHFGYGEGNAVSGTAMAPYYTIGQRAANTDVGNYSVAEGKSTEASGYVSHAEGANTTAAGRYSHAEGADTTADGDASHAGGTGTIAAYANQTAIGRYNDNKSGNLFEIGNGAAGAASNAFEVDDAGNTTVAGDLTIRTAQLKKTLVSGQNWSSGTLAVSGISAYSMVLVKLVGEATLLPCVIDSGYLRGGAVWVNASNHIITYSVSATVSEDNVLTYVNSGYMRHNASGNHGAWTAVAVEKIIGLI